MDKQLVQYEASEYYPGTYTGHTQAENYVEIKTDNLTTLRIYVLEPNVLRFRFATEGVFESDFSYGIDPAYQSRNPEITVFELNAEIVIKTESLECRINKKHLYHSIYNKNGDLILEDEKGFHWEEHHKFGGNIVQMSKKVQTGEAYFGLGDKPVEPNLRGKRFKNFGTDQYGYTIDTDPLYKNINFYYGYHNSQAYGIFFDNSFKSYFDFASERRTVTSFWASGGEMNYYFIYGPELINVAEDYTRLTGTPEMPPLWALGYQQCKWSYFPEKEVMDVAGKLRELEIPCDAIYLDIDYMDGFRCFTWDNERFPDPKGMVDRLRDTGFQTMVIIDPGIKIDHEYPVFKEAFEKGYFCRRADGPYVKGKVWPGDCYFPDFTNPEVREWWAGLFKELISETGVAGVWNDMNEPALFEVESKTFPDDVRMDYDGHPCSHRKGHNIYGMQMTRATFEGVKQNLGGKRPLIITRSGYNGLQRYTSVWTGDNLASWEHLLIAHYQTQRLNICGISFCGSDIGGFIGQPSGELFVRWIQQAIFHPFMRTHSSGDHGDQEPWSFGKKYLDHVRRFINIRYRILPYLYTTFYQYHKHGTPMLRPTEFMHHEDASELINKKIECYLGDNILFAPIVQPGSTGRLVHLPEGNWYDYYNHKYYTGNKEYYIDADLDKIPFFVKAGTVFPEFPLMQYTGEKKVEEITLKVFVEEGEHQSYLYCDDYDGYQYESGENRYSRFVVKKEDNSIEIRQEFKSEYIPQHDQFKLVLIGLKYGDKTLEMSVDDKEFISCDPENIVLSRDFSKFLLKLV
ncbi:MAG: DUF4968 domain-containing protein [Saprospiraceae bacterium]|nr:DUF4968 domain-containing protein [Saprospiraceae bacterium]